MLRAERQNLCAQMAPTSPGRTWPYPATIGLFAREATIARGFIWPCLAMLGGFDLRASNGGFPGIFYLTLKPVPDFACRSRGSRLDCLSQKTGHEAPNICGAFPGGRDQAPLP